MLVNCPECGEKTALLNNVCEHCGCKVKICSECGNVMKENAVVCDYCGCEFSSLEKKEKEEYVKKVKKEAMGIIASIEQKQKTLRAFKFILGLIGAILVVIPVGLFISAINTQEITPTFLLELESKVKSYRIMFAIFISIALIGESLVDDLYQLILPSYVIKKISEKKFDYVTYYKNISFDAKGNICVLSNNPYGSGDLLLLNAIRYKIKPESKTKKIIKTVVKMVCIITAIILCCKGLFANVNALTALTLLGQRDAFKFDFNGFLIAAIIVYFVTNIVFNFIIDDQKKEITNWVKKAQQK